MIHCTANTLAIESSFGNKISKLKLKKMRMSIGMNSRLKSNEFFLIRLLGHAKPSVSSEGPPTLEDHSFSLKLWLWAYQESPAPCCPSGLPWNLSTQSRSLAGHLPAGGGIPQEHRRRFWYAETETWGNHGWHTRKGRAAKSPCSSAWWCLNAAHPGSLSKAVQKREKGAKKRKNCKIIYFLFCRGDLV